MPEGQSDPQDINRNEDLARQCQRRRLRLRKAVSRRLTEGFPLHLSRSERRWGRGPAVSERHTTLASVSSANSPFRGWACVPTKKARPAFRRSGMGMRQRPTLPGRLQPSTIGVLRLNFCVRNGNRWNPQAITTAICERCLRALPCTLTTVYEYLLRDLFIISLGLIESTKSSYRPISIIKLHTLLHFHR